MSKEEELLKQIISSCELILDDMDQGARISEANFNILGLTDNAVFKMQQEINKQLNPSNYNG
tara:strand:+ start:61 stop:246 length:186 start_codon:yes stop_codon:yes gene_type:complete